MVRLCMLRFLSIFLKNQESCFSFHMKEISIFSINCQHLKSMFKNISSMKPSITTTSIKVAFTKSQEWTMKKNLVSLLNVWKTLVLHNWKLNKLSKFQLLSLTQEILSSMLALKDLSYSQMMFTLLTSATILV